MIRTEAQYQSSVKEVECLMNLGKCEINPVLIGSTLGNKLDSLLSDILSYENRHYDGTCS